MAEILITGGTSGIGLEMARGCLRHGHRIVITGRSVASGEAAAEALRAEIPNADVQMLAMDLGDFDAVDTGAGTLAQLLPKLERVILNAGSFTPKLRRLPNGLESMIGSMHFGHFRLMQHVLPGLLKRDAARVVVTSSVAHWAGTINEASFTDPKRHWSALAAYGQAKLANLMFARELARRTKDQGLRVNAFHPGAVATGIWRELPKPAQAVVDRVMITPERGADTGLWLALNAEAGTSGDGYFVRRKPARSSRISRNAERAAALWEYSTSVAGLG